jgi:hypothetical protein
MKNRLLTILVTISLLASFFAVFPVYAQTPAVNVEPALNEFYSDTDPVGTTFEVSVIAYNVSSPGFYGWEFFLYWTPGVIDCVGEVLNTAIWSPNSGGLVALPIDNVAGEYHQGMAGRAPAPLAIGTFWLANLTFEIVAPAPYLGYEFTDLTLGPGPGLTYILIDDLVNEITHTWGDAEYYYHWAAPTTLPSLEVDPAVNIFAGKNIYNTPFSFSVDINIRDVDAGWRLAGVEFLLFYNTTVLDVLSVTNGTFFEPFAVNPTFFLSQVFEGLGKIRIVYAVLGPFTAVPFGDGLIATIEFNATHQEAFPVAVSSDLDIQVDVENGLTSYFVNYLGDELDYDPATDGYYELAGYVFGRVIDLYTCVYDDPYGGQGPMQPSDMFWPQKEVCLCANVTYNNWPVQNKLVAFEVRDPSGALVTILTATSNEYGVACTSYRIPWPCDDPEALIGVWTVIATVDIACIVVNDTMQFHFDYLVNIIDVFTDKTEYGHCEDIKVTVEFTSHAMQERAVLLTVVIHDELNYPIGVAYFNTTIGGAVWCQAKYYMANFTIHVPKHAAAGLASIYANAYNTWPSLGGGAVAVQYGPVNVLILAEWA